MKVLIAEDEKDTAVLYKDALEEKTNNGENCLKIYQKEFQDIKKEQIQFNIYNHLVQ